MRAIRASVRSPSAFAAAALLALLACDGGAQSRVQNAGVPRRPAMLVSLPTSDRVVVVGLRPPRIRSVVELEPSSVKRPFGIASGPGGVVVAGHITPAGIARIDPETGVVSTSRVLSFGFKAHEPIFGLDGSLYITGDEKPIERGSLLKVDPETLEEQDRVEIGLGQAGAAVASDGRIWTIANEGYEEPVHTFSVVDPETMRATTGALPGRATGIAAGPRGAMFVTLHLRNEVVELLPSGRLGRRLPGISFRPWGIDIAPSGVGIVTTEGSRAIASRVYIIDFERLQVLREVRVQPPCNVAREVEIVADRAFVTCSDPPRLLEIAFPSGKIGDTVDLAPAVRSRWQLGDEHPRGLVLVGGGA